MKKILLNYLTVLFLSILAATNLMAQKETYDIVTYTAPPEWTKEVTETITSYSIVNKINNSWCRINIVKSTASKGSIELDFDSEWQELVIKNYTPPDTPQVNEVLETDGWKIKTGAGKFTFNNSDAIAMLTTASGYNRCVSIVALTNSQEYTKDIEALLASVELKKPEMNTQPTTGNSGTTSVIGTWGVSRTTASFYNTSTSEGSIVTQYTFKANGTYSFYIKTFQYLLRELLLTRETGTYQISGNNITITPQKSAVEAWSKKNGTDKWGNLISSQKRALEKTTYQFSTEDYGNGIVLVLKAGKETKRDGHFNNSGKDAWFYPSKSDVELIILPGDEQQTTSANPAGQQQGYTFTTTNFDDGWTGTGQENWVQLTKGDITVLIHYPDKQADAYNSVVADGLKNAWNILVAPKYTTLTNFECKPIYGWQVMEFAEADVMEKTSGKPVHVVLFKRNYSNGSGKYVEVITPDKNSFEKEFGAYNASASDWPKMENLVTYNKFAVAAADLTGKWTNNFTGHTQYVNAITGFDAGMNTHASNENFQFGPGNTYKWDLGVASGMVGNIKFQSAKSNGRFSVVGNWQVSFSDIEGKPRTYNAYFSCIKKFRVLWIDGSPFIKKTD